MGIVFGLVYIALLVFLVALIIRLVFDWVQMFARSWRPRGVALVAAHAVYTVTDKPLKLFRRLIPPLRLGGVSLDLGFLLLFIAVSIAMSVAKYLVYSQPLAA
ncbi:MULTISPECIES: YggT family protein [unclassified Arthrobacter]|uniref:YggT family protein n=1 Tax=unclassified Arthrobacter TaxID=235627 RepID=UPI002DFECF66|nr:MULTISPECIES: YggT family protein [unclassified Arthrobacter]MEC5192337.1 YggT family protein [Arthrobacter sp. MP_M4]MEC5203762.1 YggT family protein [Arthrobacter sp. MP_M7]